MKTFQKLSHRLAILFLILLASACGSRKLKTDQTKSTAKTETATDVKTSTSVEDVKQETVVQKVTASDHTTVTEDQDYSVNADSAVYNAGTGDVSLKGNVKITGKKKKLTEVDKQLVADLLFDVLTSLSTSELKDSSVLDKSQTSTESYKKDLDVKRGFNWWLLLAAIPVVIIGGFAIKAALR